MELWITTKVVLKTQKFLRRGKERKKEREKEEGKEETQGRVRTSKPQSDVFSSH